MHFIKIKSNIPEGKMFLHVLIFIIQMKYNKRYSNKGNQIFGFATLLFLSLTTIAGTSVSIDFNLYIMNPNLAIGHSAVYKFDTVNILLSNGTLTNTIGTTRENNTLNLSISEFAMDHVTFTQDFYFENGTFSHAGAGFTQNNNEIQRSQDRFIMTTNESLIQEVYSQFPEVNYTISATEVKINSTVNISASQSVFAEAIFNKTSGWATSTYLLAFNTSHPIIAEIYTVLLAIDTPVSITTSSTSPSSTTPSTSITSSTSTPPSSTIISSTSSNSGEPILTETTVPSSDISSTSLASDTFTTSTWEFLPLFPALLFIFAIVTFKKQRKRLK